MDRSYVANTILALLITLTVWGLWSIGETRIDAYLTFFVLEYTIVKTILRPRRAGLDWLFVLLLMIFFTCVGFRVYEVLMP